MLSEFGVEESFETMHDRHKARTLHQGIDHYHWHLISSAQLTASNKALCRCMIICTYTHGRMSRDKGKTARYTYLDVVVDRLVHQPLPRAAQQGTKSCKRQYK